MNRQRKRRLSQQDLRQLGVQPGLLAVRRAPDEERVEVRQLAAEAKPRPPFGPGLTHRDAVTRDSERS